MCSKRLLKLLVLFLLLLLVPSSWCFSDVILTDSQAQELMSEIQESKKDLESVQNELTESKKELEIAQNDLKESEKECQELKTLQEDVKNTYEEQSKSYKKQLTKAKVSNGILVLIDLLVTAILFIFVI